jgi:hypothetical protein
MTRLAFPAAWIAAIGFAACGGGNNNPADIIITIPDEADATVPPLCDPVQQTGCAEGEQCTWEVASDNPLAGRTACLPEGTVDVRDPCLPAGTERADECLGASYCIGGACTPVCTIDPDSCGPGTLCTLVDDVFDDLNDTVGVCTPICDPVMQTCPLPQACYLVDRESGKGACAAVPAGAATQTQDKPCYESQPGVCDLTGCARGFSTFDTKWKNFTEYLCMQTCTPVRSGIGMLDYIRGNPNGVVCGDHDPSAGEIANTECRFFNALLGNEGSETPDLLGICVSESVRDASGFGSCATHDLNAAPTLQNVANGSYVIGCEPWSDLVPW